MYIDPVRHSGRPADDRIPQELAIYDELERQGISFDRVDHDHADTMEDCRKIEEVLGAKVILMTDRRTSPLANKADVVVTAQVDGLGFTNSYVAPLSLSEVILLSVSGRRDVTDSKRFNRIDSVMDREKLY